MRKSISIILVAILIVSGIQAVALTVKRSGNEYEESYIKNIKVEFKQMSFEDSDEFLMVNLEDVTTYFMDPGKPIIPKVVTRIELPFGAKNVEALCNQMDILDIGSNPAIALGGLEVGITPLEISKVFSTLASGGVYHKPVIILKITDSEDNILFQYDPEDKDNSKRILDEPVSHYVTRILRKVMETGTGRGADTVCLIKPAPTSEFKNLKVKAILAKPFNF